MIVVNNLTKVYKTKFYKKSVALDNISFTLPDTGLIFIIGKSGSGKSTLLNMLGGLDDYTKGEIIADGNSFNKFTSEDFMKYRSSYLGFVFQHFNLIEDMTVRQNIELSLDISGVEDKTIVDEVLKEVEMTEYINRYPSELSGGQRQRVAIARAIAKNPKLILGDEPTGNLDNKTSELIMNLLKNISKEKLVVIVSHDLESAYKYGDRIIELHGGKIISDNERIKNYENRFTVYDNEINLPYRKDLTEIEAKKLEYAYRLKRVQKISQLDNGFKKTNELILNSKKTKLTSHKISFRNVLKLAGVFLNKRKTSRIGIVLIVTLIFVMTCLIQSFIQFDPNIYNVDSYSGAVVLQKSVQTPFNDTIYSSPIYGILEEEYLDITEKISTGNVYKLYNYNVMGVYGNNKIQNNMTKDYKRNYEQFYAQESLGTLNCSKEYLIKTFGFDGKINLLAGSLDEKDYGIIITDYMADSLLHYISQNYRSYDELIGYISPASNVYFGYVNGIIDTNYEEKYNELIKEYERSEDYELTYQKVSKTSLYEEFLHDANTNLAVGYNISDNFEEAISKNATTNVISFRGATIISNVNDENKSYQIDGSSIFHLYNQKKYSDIKDGEVYLSYSSYNRWFDTNYSSSNLSSFIPHDFTFEVYVDGDKTKGVLFSKTYRIAKLISATGDCFINEKEIYNLLEANYLNYGLYLDGVKNASDIVNIASIHGVYVQNIDYDNILMINKINQSFIPFFRLILFLLYIFEVIYLINFGINNIRTNLFEIGVIKSLGGRTRDIGIIFIANVILSGILICVFSIITSPILINISDRLLVNSFTDVMKITIYEMSIVKTIPVLIAFNLFIIMIISFLSAIISLITLYRVKPIEIIKAKE